MNIYNNSFNEDLVTTDWIANNIDKYKIERKSLITDLGLSKSVLSLYLSGKRNLSKMGKATFFYYFLTLELQQKTNS
jgi:hypothetical protein